MIQWQKFPLGIEQTRDLLGYGHILPGPSGRIEKGCGSEGYPEFVKTRGDGP
jgi:hypothetical protein